MSYQIYKFNIEKSKMAFSALFSRQYIQPYLQDPIDQFPVLICDSTEIYNVRFYVSTDDRATLTIGWTSFLEGAGIDVGTTCVFQLYDRDGQLELCVHNL